MNVLKFWISFCTILAAVNGIAAGNEVTHQVASWNGEQAAKGSGWTNAGGHGEISLRPQTAIAHSGNTALELRCQGTHIGSGPDGTGRLSPREKAPMSGQ